MANSNAVRDISVHCEEKTEADNVTPLELQRDRRVLYFSDGTLEEASDSDLELDVTDKSLDLTIDETEMDFIPLLKYKVCKIGSNILSGIDYIGGGLASFLGITTPKYTNEIEQYSRSKNNYEPEVEGNETWKINGSNSGNNNLVEVITKGPMNNRNCLAPNVTKNESL